jgi:uncharacterized protein (DUF952 family)
LSVVERMRKKNRVTWLFLLGLATALSVSKALASETLFYIVKQSDWLTYANKASFSPPSLSRDGFISLLTPEQVIPTAQVLFQGQKDLLLLKLNLSSADPLLKWDELAGNEASSPRYYGELPRRFVKKVERFQPRKDGNFSLPNEPLTKRLMPQLLPRGLISKFLTYQNWQNTDRFHQLQVDNFLRPKVQLQWWYFDFFLQDGSSMVLTFIPQHWWQSAVTKEKKVVFTISLKTRQGVVKRFSSIMPQSELKTAADHLEIPGRLLIQHTGSSTDNHYQIRVNFPEVTGVFDIRPTQPPFAAYPTGVMPGVLQTVLSGVHIGAPSFSYVSQIPNSYVSGSISWDDYQAKIEGQAYHEQGRLNDTPTRQAASWTWYHFAGSGWNIFGTPGSYIYLQRGDEILRSGFHLVSQQYTLQNRTFSSPDHAKLLTGGEINFRHEKLAFQLKLSGSSSKTLICFPSPDPNQVWGTVEGPATLLISDGSTTKLLDGRMFLETCSWDVFNKPKND